LQRDARPQRQQRARRRDSVKRKIERSQQCTSAYTEQCLLVSDTQHIATHNTLQHTTRCNTQLVATHKTPKHNTLQHTAHCNTQHVATHKTLKHNTQYTATCCRENTTLVRNTLQHTATRYNTPQLAATHGNAIHCNNTLQQYTATHSSRDSGRVDAEN